MQDVLQAAIEHHQRGQWVEAQRLYQSILARNPNHADALHLLGVLAHQCGQHSQAAELISRAIVLRPNVAVYHANLGEVWRCCGRFDRALGCAHNALRLQPHYPEAVNNLGLALMQSGRTPEAIEQFRLALQLRPRFAMAHNNLGNALRSQGDVKQAIEHFRLALECDPQLVESHSNLGQLLCERKQLHEALPHCKKAVERRPTFAEAHSNLGNVLREMGRLDEARMHYTEAMRLNPAIGMVYNNMAQLLQEEGKFAEALAWYHEALQRDPNSPRIHCNLASALGEKERHDEAQQQYEIALRLDPNHAEAHNGLGFLRQEQGRDEEAKKHYQTALRLMPDFAAAHGNLGALLEELNDLRGAEECFRAAIRHDPTNAAAHAHLATMLRSKLPEDDLNALRALLAEADLPDGKRAGLCFGLAHVLDGRGQYAEAAELLRRANALNLDLWRKRGEVYDSAAHTRFVTEMMAVCDAAFFQRVRGWGLDSERPVFIVGLPRSGTTLIEQVLASHSQVFGAGELRLAREGFESLPALLGGDNPMTCLARLDAAIVGGLGLRHLDQLHALNDTAARVVDKMPDNYLYLGLLTTLFPRAKFIHCRRDLRDVAVSCWMTNFRQIRWASAFDDLASRFREYQRLMQHWRDVLPVAVLEIAYEDTVADLENVARRLTEWCGLDWEPSCLAFHESRRPVRTASVTQVRQPLYKHAVARWKHYETELGSLFAKLDECAPRAV